jgi:putative flippase GtrA
VAIEGGRAGRVGRKEEPRKTMPPALELTGRFLRFCAVGAVATGIQYVILFALVATTPLLPEIASGIGFFVSALANYQMNRRLTFRSGRPHTQAMPRFFLLVLCGLGLNSLVLSLGYRVLGLPLLLAQIVATGFVLLWNFTGSQIWVFPRASERETSS